LTDEAYWNRKIADELSQINNQLRVLVTLELANMKMTLMDKVDILYKAGFTPSDIATVLGTSATSVSSMVYQRKRKNPVKKRQNVEPTTSTPENTTQSA
jgi:ribosomal protein S8